MSEPGDLVHLGETKISSVDDRDPEGFADELRATERRRLASLVAADAAGAEAVHATDYQLITPSGACLSREDYLEPIAEGVFVYRRFEPTGEIVVRTLGPSAAALRYEVKIEVEFPRGYDAGRFWHTDIYERREGRWQAVWSQATRIPSR